MAMFQSVPWLLYCSALTGLSSFCPHALKDKTWVLEGYYLVPDFNRLPVCMYKQEAHIVEQPQFGKPTDQIQFDPTRRGHLSPTIFWLGPIIGEITETTLKNWRNPESPRDNTWQSLGLILSCNKVLMVDPE